MKRKAWRESTEQNHLIAIETIQRRAAKAKGSRAFADILDMKVHTAKCVCLLILVGLAVPALRGQSTDEAAARSKIVALEHAWNQAEAFKDLTALNSLFDSELIYVDADGTLMTKAEFLSHVKSAHLQQEITQSMAVQVFGDTAVATGTYLAKEFKDGRPVVHNGRFIDIWIRRDQTWVCISAQATPRTR
jgi:ketosteroid isomerase-like protein